MRGKVLLLAGGDGQRLGRGRPKAFVPVGGVAMIRRAAEAACAAKQVDALVAVVPSDATSEAESVLEGIATPIRVVAGGPTRQSSAAHALSELAGADAVVVHDAARPLCPPALFDSCLEWLDTREAVVVAVPVWDTLKQGRGGWIERTVDRAEIVAAQTPQAFHADLYRRAHEAAAADAFEGTDDSSLVERLGARVWYIVGDPRNIKITTEDDLRVAEALL